MKFFEWLFGKKKEKMKMIYAITRYDRKTYNIVYYKYYADKEMAKNELKELAKTYLEEDVRWNKCGDLIALNDIWTVREICVN